MSEVPFHATREGQRFLGYTLPELVRHLDRLAPALEKLAEDGRVRDQRGRE